MSIHPIPPLLTILFAVPISASTILIADDTFADSNWSHAKIVDTTPSMGATFTAVQSVSGGNAGAFQEGTHDWIDGFVAVAHVTTVGGSYDPSVDGAIASLTFDFDFKVISGRPSSASTDVAASLLVLQSGNYYVADADIGFPISSFGEGWVHHQQVVSEADFFLALPSGFDLGAHPDFGASGDPIQFGYASLNSAPFERGTTWGIDNLLIIPEPSHAVLSLVSIALIGFRRRRT